MINVSLTEQSVHYFVLVMSIFGVRLRVLIPLRPVSWSWAVADACKDPLITTANNCVLSGGANAR